MRRFLAAVAVVALTACSGVDEGEKVDGGAPAAEAPAAGQPATTVPAPSATKAVGDKVALANGDTIQVHSYTPNVAASNQFAKPTAGMTFSVIDVEGCAKGANATGVVNPFYFALQMADNTRAEPTFLPVKTPELHSGAQAPGDCIRGNVGFEVPSAAKPIAVVFTSFGTSVKWNIP